LQHTTISRDHKKLTTYKKKNMSCTNAATDINNKFHQGSTPSLPTLLVHYGPYMN